MADAPAQGLTAAHTSPVTAATHLEPGQALYDPHQALCRDGWPITQSEVCEAAQATECCESGVRGVLTAETQVAQVAVPAERPANADVRAGSAGKGPEMEFVEWVRETVGSQDHTTQAKQGQHPHTQPYLLKPAAKDVGAAPNAANAPRPPT